MTRTRVLVLTSFVAITAHLTAGTVHVPDAAAGIVTLQDGFDAANSGDTIKIDAGIYRENVSVTDKEDLRVLAQGSVVIDARPSGVTPSGPGLTLSNCSGLELTGVAVRHASGVTPNGAGIRVTASSRMTFTGVTVTGCDDAGIDVEGSQVTFDGCVVSGCRGGIAVMGSNVKVRNTRVTNDRLRGIGVTGDQVEVDRCAISVVRAGGGIEITGDYPTVTRCDVAAVMDAPGIITTGASPEIRKNTVRDGDIGIDVVYGAFGIVEKNSVDRCSNIGIRTGGASHDLKLKRNVVRNSCTSIAAAFHIEGDGGHDLVKNDAFDCAGDGFKILCPTSTLSGNRALRCSKDGFDVDVGVAGVALTDNFARKNLGEGFENSGDDTVLSDNVAKKNRVGFANDGTVDAGSSGNSFAVAGAPAPEID